MGDPMAPSEREGNSEGGGAEQAGEPRYGRKDTIVQSDCASASFGQQPVNKSMLPTANGQRTTYT
jgi:hypothetical protein